MREPEVPVTTIVELVGAGGGGGLLEPPPPHDPTSPTTPRARRSRPKLEIATLLSRRFTKAKSSIRNNAMKHSSTVSKRWPRYLTTRYAISGAPDTTAVLTLTVIGAPPEPEENATDVGETVQALPGGPPSQDTETVPWKLPWGPNQTVKLAVCPAPIVRVEGKVLLFRTKSSPVPSNPAPTLLPFVSVTKKFVERTLPAVGAKEMLTTQLA